MARRTLRLRVDDTGSLEVVDPGLDTLELLQAIDPGFRIRRAALPAFRTPRFTRLRQQGCGLVEGDSADLSEAALWEVHGRLAATVRVGSPPRRRQPGEASVLALKAALAERLLAPCRLCALRCGVDRRRGERGRCALGPDATVAEHFVHIGEEAPINPSLMISLAGCGLRCRFCQQSPLLKPDQIDGEPLDATLWARLDTQRARSLSFIGGNPDESLPAILRFLEQAPTGWKLPIVWNSHAYATPETLRLLDGVVDAYVPDFKFASERCGHRLAGIADYPQLALAAIKAMLGQGVPVLVRVLVLPGHVDCCHVPALQSLAALQAPHLVVSIRGQYYPAGRVTVRDGALARRPTTGEIAVVRQQARNLGLRMVG